MYNAIKSIKEDLDSGELSFIEVEQELESEEKEIEPEEGKDEENGEEDEESFIPDKIEQKTLFDINKKE